jgi:hypothetical protein
MSSDVTIVLKAVDQASAVLNKAGGGAKGLTSNLLSLAKAAGVVTLAYKGFDYLKTAVTDTVAYAEEVRDLSRALGINAEESSKLIQIADDLKIDQKQLQVAFRYALNKGVDPSIEGLKALQAEYQAIQDPIERAQFAMEKFGTRGGLEMQKVLELSSEALDEMAQSAIDAGLVLSDESVKAAREYEIAVDNLSDKVEGLKTKLGVGLIPILVEFIDLADKMTSLEADTWFEEGADAAAKFINKVIYGKDTVDNYNVAMERFAKENEIAIGVTEDLTGALDELSAEEGEGIDVLGMAIDAVNDSNAGLRTKIELEEKLKLLSGQLTQEELDLKEAIDFLTRMLEDGKITQEEYLALVQQLAVDGSLAAEIVKGLGNAILLLPDSKDIHINVKYHKYGEEPGPGVPLPPGGDLEPGLTPGGATGLHGIVPPGYPNDSYYVRATSGERVDITPQAQINNWNLTINEAGSRGNVVMDFALLKALARG